METSSTYYKVYRITASRLRTVCISGLAGWGAITFGSRNTYASLAGLAIVIVIVLLGSLRVTIISSDGITVRGPLLAYKTIRWADIQDIHIKINKLSLISSPYISTETPKKFVIIYDRNGKQTGLPNVTEESLGGEKALQVEVERLRRTWEQLRGNDWGSQPNIIKATG